MTSRRYPREPGSAIVRGASRCRKVIPAQWRTRHPDVARLPVCPVAVAASGADSIADARIGNLQTAKVLFRILLRAPGASARPWRPIEPRIRHSPGTRRTSAHLHRARDPRQGGDRRFAHRGAARPRSCSARRRPGRRQDHPGPGPRAIASTRVPPDPVHLGHPAVGHHRHLDLPSGFRDLRVHPGTPFRERGSGRRDQSGGAAHPVRVARGHERGTR